MSERNMQPSSMDKADLVTSLLLIGLGLGAVIESWRMPRLEELAVNPYTVPGIVPGLLGAIIVLLGAILLARALRRGGWRLDAGGVVALLRRESARRLYLSLALTFGYASFPEGGDDAETLLENAREPRIRMV